MIGNAETGIISNHITCALHVLTLILAECENALFICEHEHIV